MYKLFLPHKYIFVDPSALWAFRSVGILISLLLLNACMTPLQQVGQKHQTAAEKWHELAKYTSSNIPHFGFTVTASLEIAGSETYPEIKLTNIQLRHDEDRHSINLLNPQFEHKYLCRKGCVQLVEYDSKNGALGNTLVAEYLNKYEFELFRFHADLFVLNDVLVELAEENNNLLDDYLYYLSTKGGKFSSLADITAFLNTELTMKKFRGFLTDPQYQYSNLVFKMIADNPELTPVNRLLRQTIIEQGNQDNKLWGEDENNDPSVSWNVGTLTNDPSSDWDLTDNANQFPWQLAEVTVVGVSIWSQARALPVAVGDTVCSFTDNYFGMLKSIDPNQQMGVFIQGQAKQEKDGIISNLQKGSLFIENNTLEFLPMIENKVLSSDDIARCSIQ
ncbi:hypothetical protein QX776_12515 [Alteromonadaceae bacterium BrNp21-10]|nr:hypothetical protein [Alteromonadaceae bacterium BrNp21-10]